MDHPMDEPFDEIMGMNPKKNVQTQGTYSSSVITPDPSPTYNASAPSRQSSAPPSNAFVHTSSQDRWAQYERDDKKLQQESAQAYATAVASAAERAAMRDSMSPSNNGMDGPHDEMGAPPDTQFRRYYDNPKEVGDRLNRAGASLPPPEPRSTRRTESGATPKEILKSLSRAAQMNKPSRQYEDDENVEVVFSSPHDQVRAEALKVLEMADEKTGKSDNFDTTSTSSSRRRTPAALSGLDFSGAGSVSSSSRKPYRDDRFAIDDNDVDIVDVVEAERNSGGRAFDMEGENASQKSWSSRYSNPLNSHLSALTGANRSSASSILDSYDKSHKRQVKSDRNTSFNSSRSSSSPSSGGVFGSGFSFRQKNEAKSPSQYNLQNHRTVWMDADNSSNGKSLPPPVPARSWQSNLERKRVRRRRSCIALLLVVVIAVILGIVFGTRDNGGDGGSFSLTGDGVGQSITFYVTADVPVDSSDAQKLAGDLAVIPGDSDFLVHLGNIQDASVTLCNEAVYTDASIILEESPVPVYIIPGEQDWNNCPNPELGWMHWMNNFEEFESNFDTSHFSTDRQLGRTENFSFTHRGVLFIGLHLLGGRIHDDGEWRLRHTENVQWVEEKLSEDPDSYRAVVLLGNARPSQQQHEFFREVVRDIKEVDKPTLYVHANGGSGFEEYRPFDDAGKLSAVQLGDGGESPPLRITVGFGGKPFLVGLPDDE